MTALLELVIIEGERCGELREYRDEVTLSWSFVT